MKIEGSKMWYPGHADAKIHRETELCMFDAVRRIQEREEPELSVGQYNAVYEAVERIIAALQEAEG